MNNSVFRPRAPLHSVIKAPVVKAEHPNGDDVAAADAATVLAEVTEHWQTFYKHFLEWEREGLSADETQEHFNTWMASVEKLRVLLGSR